MSADLVPAAVEQPDQRLDQRLVRLGNIVEAAAAVNTATRLGILELLRDAPAPADEVARHCATAPGPTQLLMDALDGLGVLRRRSDGSYAATLEAGWCTTLAAGWSHLDEVVRSGHPMVAADTPAGAAELYPEVVATLSRLCAPAVVRAAELLAPVGGEVLDVGAGAAPWSIAIARADTAVRVTALDVPDVLRGTRRAVEAAGLASRFRFHGGDMFTADLPAAAYDLVLLGNVCHLFGPDANRALLRRLRPALRPGGTLAIVDALPAEDPAQRWYLGLYALGLRLRTSEGAVYPLEGYAVWTREAGYGELSAVALSQRPALALLTCTTPRR
jgi:SAM-dependent methyltransferase